MYINLIPTELTNFSKELDNFSIPKGCCLTYQDHNFSFVDPRTFNWQQRFQYLFGYGPAGFLHLSNVINQKALEALSKQETSYISLKSKIDDRIELTSTDVSAINRVHQIKDWRLNQLDKIATKSLPSYCTIWKIFYMFVDGIIEIPAYFQALFSLKKLTSVQAMESKWCQDLTSIQDVTSPAIEKGKILLAEMGTDKVCLQFHRIGQTLSIEKSNGELIDQISFQKFYHRNGKNYLSLLSGKQAYQRHFVLEGILNLILNHFKEIEKESLEIDTSSVSNFVALSNQAVIQASARSLKDLKCLLTEKDASNRLNDVESKTILFDDKYISTGKFIFLTQLLIRNSQAEYSTYS